MTNPIAKNTSKAAASANAENRALSVITAGSATEFQAHAIYMAIEPLARRAYLHNNDPEQWANKPTNARPIRPFWATMYASNGTNKDGTPKWVNKNKPARAMRAAASIVLSALNDKFRDKSKDGLEIFLLSIETAIIGVIAPAKSQVERDATSEAEKAKNAIAKAIKLLQEAKNNHLLSEDQLSMLADMFTSANKAASTNQAASTNNPEPALA